MVHPKGCTFSCKCFINKELTLYFYNNDELVTDELVVAIMENNLSKVEKQIINNLKKMAEEG